jgi:hypothetical protein
MNLQEELLQELFSDNALGLLGFFLRNAVLETPGLKVPVDKPLKQRIYGVSSDENMTKSGTFNPPILQKIEPLELPQRFKRGRHFCCAVRISISSSSGGRSCPASIQQWRSKRD